MIQFDMKTNLLDSEHELGGGDLKAGDTPIEVGQAGGHTSVLHVVGHDSIQVEMVYLTRIHTHSSQQGGFVEPTKR